MPLNERVLPFLEAAFGPQATVRAGNPRHFLVTRPIPTSDRPHRFAHEIVVQIERDLERAIVNAAEEQMAEEIGPRILQAIPAKLVGYEAEYESPNPFLVILSEESIGR